MLPAATTISMGLVLAAVIYWCWEAKMAFKTPRDWRAMMKWPAVPLLHTKCISDDKKGCGFSIINSSWAPKPHLLSLNYAQMALRVSTLRVSTKDYLFLKDDLFQNLVLVRVLSLTFVIRGFSCAIFGDLEWICFTFIIPWNVKNLLISSQWCCCQGTFLFSLKLRISHWL